MTRPTPDMVSPARPAAEPPLPPILIAFDLLPREVAAVRNARLFEIETLEVEWGRIEPPGHCISGLASTIAGRTAYLLGSRRSPFFREVIPWIGRLARDVGCSTVTIACGEGIDPVPVPGDLLVEVADRHDALLALWACHTARQILDRGRDPAGGRPWIWGSRMRFFSACGDGPYETMLGDLAAAIRASMPKPSCVVCSCLGSWSPAAHDLFALADSFAVFEDNDWRPFGPRALGLLAVESEPNAQVRSGGAG